MREQKIPQSVGPGEYEVDDKQTKTAITNVIINPYSPEKVVAMSNIGPGAYEEPSKFGENI